MLCETMMWYLFIKRSNYLYIFIIMLLFIHIGGAIGFAHQLSRYCLSRACEVYIHIIYIHTYIHVHIFMISITKYNIYILYTHLYVALIFYTNIGRFGIHCLLQYCS